MRNTPCRSYHWRSETPLPALYHKSLCNTMSSGLQKYSVRPTSGTSRATRRCILARANGVSSSTNTATLNMLARWMTVKGLRPAPTQSRQLPQRLELANPTSRPLRDSHTHCEHAPLTAHTGVLRGYDVLYWSTIRFPECSSSE